MAPGRPRPVPGFRGLESHCQETHQQGLLASDLWLVFRESASPTPNPQAKRVSESYAGEHLGDGGLGGVGCKTSEGPQKRFRECTPLSERS